MSKNKSILWKNLAGGKIGGRVVNWAVSQLINSSIRWIAQLICNVRLSFCLHFQHISLQLPSPSFGLPLSLIHIFQFSPHLRPSGSGCTGQHTAVARRSVEREPCFALFKCCCGKRHYTTSFFFLPSVWLLQCFLNWYLLQAHFFMFHMRYSPGVSWVEWWTVDMNCQFRDTAQRAYVMCVWALFAGREALRTRL